MDIFGGIKMVNPRLLFSADYHFNHANAIKYDNRPFKSVEEMNNKIISNHNEMVKSEDVCIVIGDVYLRGGKEGGKQHYWELLKQMNGRITIIRGNHCRSNSVIDPIQSAIMHKCGLKILLIHDPINATTIYDLVLCAHVHNAWKFAELHENNKVSLLINVGVTQWDYRPVPFTKLFECYEQWKVGKIKPIIYDKQEVIKFRKERREAKNGLSKNT